jgi:hypothetical protein
MSIIRRAFTILAVGVLPIFGSCIFDAKEAGPDDKTPPVQYLPLDTRDNLLYNLELAYNQRNLEEFLKLLDNGVYQFFFSATDVSQGLVDQDSWGYAAEAEATGRLFDRSPPANDPRADKIALTLLYTEGDGAWQEMVPSSYPSETWYQKTVEYRLSVRVGETDYNQNRVIVALLTVRQKPGESIWQIVEWRDDI